MQSPKLEVQTVVDAIPERKPQEVSNKPVQDVSIKRFSINKPLKKEETQVNQQAISSNRNSNFTQEQLVQAWISFAKTIPEHIHLVNTMQSNKPLLKENAVFEVQVENSYQEKEILDMKAQLIAYLSDSLENDALQLELTINGTREVKKVMLAKDKFDYLAEKNEYFKKLVTELGLEIV